VSSDTQPRTRSSSNSALTLILAIIGVVALVVGIIYLPGGHHDLRGTAGLVVGVVLLAVAAWRFAQCRKSGSTPAAGAR
jgi:type IV secretory pathway VirB2 component (pilin)